MKLDYKKILTNILTFFIQVYQNAKRIILIKEYESYIITISLLTLLSYIFVLDKILFPIFIIIAIYVIYKKGSFMYLLPLGLFIQFSSPEFKFNDFTTIFYILSFVGLVFVDLFRNRKFKKIGKLFDPILILFVLSIAAIWNAPTFEIWLGGIYYVGFSFFAYLYFINATDNNRLNMRKLTKIFLYAGVVITFEMFYVIATSDLELLYMIEHRAIHLGWENINVVIYSNLFGIVLATQLIIDSKFRSYYMILVYICIIGVLLTLSRSSIVTVAVYILFMVPYIIVKSKEKVNLIINGIITAIIIAISIAFMATNGVVNTYIETMVERDFLNYGIRADLIQVAWNEFKSHFVIGSGGVYSSRYYLENYSTNNYHNTIAQVSTLGTLGLLAFIWLFYEKTKMILSKKSSWKWIVFVLVYVTIFINGWFQPMYFYVTFMLYLYALLAVYENIEDEPDITV